jgi:uncharacterized protein YjbI with pentapeptide repeats
MVEEKGKQDEERQDEPRLWRPGRPPRRRMGWRVLWAVGMVVAVLTTGLLIVDLRPEIWKDLLEGRVLTLVALGLSLTAIVVMLAIAGAWRSWTGFRGKTVWDWLQLLIVPIVLSLITLAFTWQLNARQNDIEDRRAQAERELAEQRAQDEALQAYLDQMSALLLEKDLRNTKVDSEVRTLAQARTRAVLSILEDPSRKTALLGFLFDADLVESAHPLCSRCPLEEREPVLSLSGTDLSGIVMKGSSHIIASLNGAPLEGAYLWDADLRDANLSGGRLSYADLHDANLRDANLHNAGLDGANLSYANLHNADLHNADLHDALLGEADLSEANLSGANLRGALLIDLEFFDPADLGGADLSGAELWNATPLWRAVLHDANLHNADLHNADLHDADLRNANLDGAEQLSAAKSLEGATMPNGQKYEDWIKDKEGRK